MHASELVELAAIVSAHGPVLVHGTRQLSETGIEQYWTTSKCRLDRWTRSLRRLTDEVTETDPRQRKTEWPLVRGVLEEILTGEMLTRVWTAVLCAHDRHHDNDRAEPVARSVLIGHLEARHRVLTLLVRGPGIDAEAALKLNHLRRRTERWTDMLIGYLLGMHDVREFAYDPDRAQDFSEDLRYRSQLKGGQHTWAMVLVSLRAAFKSGLSAACPNADLNAKIGAAILSCYPADLFDSTGLFKSLWLQRLSNVTNDAQVLVDELLTLERVAERSEAEESNTELPTAHRAGRLRRFGKS
ncbi:MAG: hypothetical protein HQ567_17530 [Candidatus Nealsonbacteria bacterium]|nr:hypothetical protein [Candidatus Nealsonbacteria bacterium]